MGLRKRRSAVIVIGAALLACALAGVGCGGDKGAASGSGSISGTVFKTGTQNPVANALVLCAGVCDTTGIDGFYQLGSVPTGVHTLAATKANYEYFSTTVRVINQGHTMQNIYIAPKGGGGGVDD